jgi:hypothetical protein
MPRPMVIAVHRHFLGQTELVGDEIGVEEGRNTLNILQELSLKKLYRIFRSRMFCFLCTNTCLRRMLILSSIVQYENLRS